MYSDKKGCEDVKKKLLVIFSILAILTFSAGCTTQDTPAPAPPANGQANPGGPDPAVPPETTDGNETGDMDLALREAKELARSIGGDGVITKYEVKDVEGEQRLMEFTIQNDAQLHKVEVDRIARQATEVEVTSNPVNMADYDAYIGLDEAERIAKERVADATARFIEFELENHGAQEGRTAYKFEIHTLTLGYEVRVDAMTGDIFEFENP
ncbi:MAG TPA: PepSY domain-containing protein [Clostridiaceae bacterium]|nr:PepSY domain-containing protein [Clostridiaceae bacterium]